MNNEKFLIVQDTDVFPSIAQCMLPGILQVIDRDLIII